MSTAATTSTVEHTGHGPSRCLACGQFAGDGHSCPPRSAGSGDHQALGLYSSELLASAPAPAPSSVTVGSVSAQTELQQARVAVGLAVLQQRRTGDRAPLEAALARRDAALTQLRQEATHAGADVAARDRCSSCGQ